MATAYFCYLLLANQGQNVWSHVWCALPNQAKFVPMATEFRRGELDAVRTIGDFVGFSCSSLIGGFPKIGGTPNHPKLVLKIETHGFGDSPFKEIPDWPFRNLSRSSMFFSIQAYIFRIFWTWHHWGPLFTDVGKLLWESEVGGVHHQLSCMHLLSVLSLQDWRLLKTNLFRMNLGGSLLFPPALSTFAFLNSGVKIKGIDGYKLVRKANGEPPRVLACQGWPDLLFGLPAVLHVEVLAPVLLECSQMMQERVGIDTCGILWPLDAKLKSQLWTCYAICLHINYRCIYSIMIIQSRRVVLETQPRCLDQRWSSHRPADAQADAEATRARRQREVGSPVGHWGLAWLEAVCGREYDDEPLGGSL